MRDILFRGKRVDNQDWVYGNLVLNKSDGLLINVYIENTDINEFRQWEVIPKTVGQFTGLTDKNGTKIFEWDILDLGQTVNGCNLFSVEWDKNRYGWNIRYHVKMNNPRLYEYSVESFFAIDEMTGEGVEIIGNIHDNPDLLEKPL